MEGWPLCCYQRYAQLARAPNYRRRMKKFSFRKLICSFRKLSFTVVRLALFSCSRTLALKVNSESHWGQALLVLTWFFSVNCGQIAPGKQTWRSETTRIASVMRCVGWTAHVAHTSYSYLWDHFLSKWPDLRRRLLGPFGFPNQTFGLTKSKMKIMLVII